MADLALTLQESMRLRSHYQWFLCSPFYRNCEEILSGSYDDLPVENVVGCCGSLQDNESSGSQDSLITCMAMDKAGQEMDSSNTSMDDESQESASSSISVSEQNSESPAPLQSFAFLQERAPLRSGDGRRPFTAFIRGDEYKALIKGCYYVPNPENPRIPLSDFAARIGGQCGADYDHGKRCSQERARKREEKRAERKRKKNEERKAKGTVDDEEKKKIKAAKKALAKKKKLEKKQKKQEKKEKKRARRAAAAEARLAAEANLAATATTATAAAGSVDDTTSKVVQNSEGNSGESSSSSATSSTH